MNGAMLAGLCWLLQTPAATPPRARRSPLELAAARARLEEVLSDRRLPATERRARLAAFLAAHGHDLTTRERGILEVRLAILDLERRAFAAALARFTAVHENAPKADVDLRARALLGRAEALAGLGRTIEARRTLAAVWDRHPGTRYARRARRLYAALEAEPPRPGGRLRRAPGLQALDGRPFTPPAGRRWLLVLPPPPPAALAAFLETIGFPPAESGHWPVPLVLLLAGGPDRERYARFAARHPAAARRILTAVVRPGAAFLVRNGIDHRPLRLFIGPGDEILDVDPPAERLAQGRSR